MHQAKKENLINAARNVCRELRKNSNIIGIFLFGSIVTGDVHPESDVDLGIIWGGPEKERPGRHTEKKFGENVEFLYLHPKQIEWMFNVGHGGCIDWFRTCEILYDPKGLIKEWKIMAKNFRWTDEQIGEQFNDCLSYLNASKKAQKEDDTLTAIVATRKASVSLARAFLMKKNNPKHLDLADLLDQLRSYPHLYSVFLNIHFGKDQRYDAREIIEKMDKLKAYASSIKKNIKATSFRKNFRDFEMHLRHVQEGVWHKNMKGALLHLRRAAHLLIGVLAEEYKGKQIDYLERICVIRYLGGDVFKLYSQIHKAEEISKAEIKNYREILFQLTSSEGFNRRSNF